MMKKKGDRFKFSRPAPNPKHNMQGKTLDCFETIPRVVRVWLQRRTMAEIENAAVHAHLLQSNTRVRGAKTTLKVSERRVLGIWYRAQKHYNEELLLGTLEERWKQEDPAVLAEVEETVQGEPKELKDLLVSEAEERERIQIDEEERVGIDWEEVPSEDEEEDLREALDVIEELSKHEDGQAE